MLRQTFIKVARNYEIKLFTLHEKFKLLSFEKRKDDIVIFLSKKNKIKK